MNDYITWENATRITGLHRRTLQHYSTNGAVRTVTHKQGRGRPSLLYHVDDIRKLTWPGTIDLEAATGRTRSQILDRLTRYQIGGAVLFSGRWRFNPDRFAAIVRWFNDGCPVRPGFTPNRRNL